MEKSERKRELLSALRAALATGELNGEVLDEDGLIGLVVSVGWELEELDDEDPPDITTEHGGGTNDGRALDSGPRQTVTILSRTDLSVDVDQLDAGLVPVGEALAGRAHDADSWDAILADPACQPLVRVVQIQSTIGELTQSGLGYDYPPAEVFAAAADDEAVLFGVVDVWRPLAP